MAGDALCEPRVELSCLRDVEPADVLLHDAVEEAAADASDLAPGRQRPERHLHVGCHHHHEAQDGVVDGVPGRGQDVDFSSEEVKPPPQKKKTNYGGGISECHTTLAAPCRVGLALEVHIQSTEISPLHVLLQGAVHHEIGHICGNYNHKRKPLNKQSLKISFFSLTCMLYCN